jgi:hypothetical protein
MAEPWEQDAPVGGAPWEQDELVDPRGRTEKFLAGVRSAGAHAIKGLGETAEAALPVVLGPAGYVVQAAGRALRPAALEQEFAKENLDRLKQEADTAGGWGSLGEFAANVGLTAAPSTQAYKALNFVKTLAQTGHRTLRAPSASSGERRSNGADNPCDVPRLLDGRAALPVSQPRA